MLLLAQGIEPVVDEAVCVLAQKDARGPVLLDRAQHLLGAHHAPAGLLEQRFFHLSHASFCVQSRVSPVRGCAPCAA